MSKPDNTPNPAIQQASREIRDAIKQATAGLIERETLADLIILAAVASEHLLVIGPPGTAKSAVVRRVANAIGGRYFEYLLGRFTEPSELFGPIDLRKLRDGTIETETTNMLPEADVAFLDEVFLGSTAVLNSLLNLLNERMFRRGHTQLQCPLRICVGSSNTLPDEESLAAFADRFLVHTFVHQVPDPLLENLLEGGWQAFDQTKQIAKDRLAQLDFLSQAARQADLSAVRPALSHCIRLLRQTGIELSDRRIVKAQILIAASAVLAGRMHPGESDLWPLIYVIATEDGQVSGRETLRDILAASENQTLYAATDDATLSPAAHATRICALAESILLEQPAADNQNQLAQWQLRLEAIGREIDTSFSADTAPEKLKNLRHQIVTILDPNPGLEETNDKTAN